MRIDRLRKLVEPKGFTVKYVNDLVDKVWKDKIALGKNPVFIHDVKYSGESTKDRIDKICHLIRSHNSNTGIIAALDQIAWIMNLRGSDINFNPYFISYMIILLAGDKVDITLYSDLEKFKDPKVQQHLTEVNVKLCPYENAMDDISKLNERKIALEMSLVNEKILSLVRGKNNKIADMGNSINLLKQIKNPVELEGFRQCHIRDGVGLVMYLAWLEHQLNVLNRTDIDEYAAAEKVLEFRKMQDMFMGLSFETISAIGPNGSIVHYEPEKGKCAIVNNKEIYLLDSGSHFL